MKIDSNYCAESPRSSVLLGTSETPYQSLVDLREDSATPPGRGVISPKPGVLNLSSFMHIDTTEEYGSYELELQILLWKYIWFNLSYWKFPCLTYLTLNQQRTEKTTTQEFTQNSAAYTALKNVTTGNDTFASTSRNSNEQNGSLNLGPSANISNITSSNNESVDSRAAFSEQTNMISLSQIQETMFSPDLNRNSQQGSESENIKMLIMI